MTKNQYQKKFDELAAIIKKANSIVLVTHKDPDGDALGASMAFKIYLEKLGKKVAIFYTGKAETCFRFLPECYIEYFKRENFLDDNFFRNKIYDLFIVSDASELKRTGLFKLKNRNWLNKN